MAREADVPEARFQPDGPSLEGIVERLERIHLQLHLEVGLLSPGSEIAQRLLDLTEETETVLQRVRSYSDGRAK